jgi:hypothetical protein
LTWRHSQRAAIVLSPRNRFALVHEASLNHAVGFATLAPDGSPVNPAQISTFYYRPIAGESGTGKELVARQIHDISPRREGPFVALNCAALVESLLETELFGIEDRTATGVRGRKGKFEHVDGGTLFLDEVGDLSASAQAKLLRALQDLSVERVGGQGTRRIDTRPTSATRSGNQPHSFTPDATGRTDGRQRGSSERSFASPRLIGARGDEIRQADAACPAARAAAARRRSSGGTRPGAPAWALPHSPPDCDAKMDRPDNDVTTLC